MLYILYRKGLKRKQEQKSDLFIGICFRWSHIPDLRGPSTIEAKARPAKAGRFFRTAPPLTKASFRRCGTARKKRSLERLRFCFGRDSVGNGQPEYEWMYLNIVE